jgi:cytosine/adenosine deaminase-related metal-dependent hydrolase
VNAARALGRSGQLGELARGARADFITLPFEGNASQVVEAVTQHHGPVLASMIDGVWIWQSRDRTVQGPTTTVTMTPVVS